MNSTRSTRRRTRAPRLAAALVGLVLAGGLAPLPALAAPTPTDKQVRQLKVMEGIMDQLLLDSPNFLVFGRDNVRGLYLEELGVLFTFEASLTSKESLPSIFSDGNFKIRRKDGQIVIEPGEESGDDDESGGSSGGGSAGGGGQSGGKKGKEGRASGHGDEEAGGNESPARKYEKGKSELIQALLDYGDTMTSLADGQSVAIAALLRDNDYFADNRISRLILRVKVRDLREFSAGRLSEVEVRNRIRVEEY
jgi:hypothetical protein